MDGYISLSEVTFMKRMLNTILFSGLIVSSFSLNAMAEEIQRGKDAKPQSTSLTSFLWQKCVPTFIRTRAESAQKRAEAFVKEAVAEKVLKDAANDAKATPE